jgi:hypothetical protein
MFRQLSEEKASLCMLVFELLVGLLLGPVSMGS